MKKRRMLAFNYMISLYVIITFSFFYNQYLAVTRVNVSNSSDIIYFLKDNVTMITLFLVIVLSIILNLFYVVEYWIFTTKTELSIKRIVGYSYKEILIEYYTNFMVHFMWLFLLAIITCIPILYYFKLPILVPIMIALVAIIIILSLLVIVMLSFCILKFKKDYFFGFQQSKVISFIFQFSVSLLLITVSMLMFFEINETLSPYKKYVAMENSWILRENLTIKDKMEVEKTPEKYRGDILNKIKNIYTQYEDNIMVDYTSVRSNAEVGPILSLNQSILEINNIDMAIFTTLQDSKYQPIVLNHTFSQEYHVGDIIAGDTFDYIVTKILQPHELITVLGPNEFVPESSDNYSITLFDNRYIERDLFLENSNFIDYIYMFDINYDEMTKINQYINEDNFEYFFHPINELQKEFYIQKTIALSGYLIVGVVNVLFSIFGLVSILYMDINSRAIELSVYRIIGYTRKSLYIKYLLSIGILFVVSYIISQIIAYQSFQFSTLVSLAVLVIVLGIYLLISVNSINYINKINMTEVLGGKNE